MRGGIPGVKEVMTYYCFYLDSPGQGTRDRGTQCIVIPRGPNWYVF